MRKHIVPFRIFMLICLGLAGCQPSLINAPTPTPTLAPTENPVTIALERINQLETQKDFEDALTILTDLRSEQPVYAEVHAVELDDRAAELYIGWGDDLRASAHYLAALEKYDLASGLTNTSSLVSQIDQGIEQTNNLLANDSGEDGKALLDAAMAEACYQEIIPTNPLIGSTILDGELGRILICDYTEAYENMPVGPGLDPQLVQSMLAAQAGINWLPEDLSATTPGSVQFTVSRLDTYDKVTSCQYANDQGLTDAIGVMRQQSMLMVRDMLTGEILAENTFNGADPAYHCPQTKVYGENNFGFGQLVDNEKIIAWIRQVLADY